METLRNYQFPIQDRRANDEIANFCYSCGRDNTTSSGYVKFGWAIPPAWDFFNVWASQYKFVVGDVLGMQNFSSYEKTK